MSHAVGAVLAGGRSRRYGSPKWAVEVGGRAMAGRALDALRPNVGALLVVGSAPGLDGLGAPVRRDLRPGRGPLAGLETALAWAAEGGASRLVVLACDLPLVSAATVAALLEEEAGAAAVVPRNRDTPHPLCAVYPVGVLVTVSDLLDGPRGALRDLLALVPVRWVEAAALPGGSDALLNANEPAERARAEALLAASLTPPAAAPPPWPPPP